PQAHSKHRKSPRDVTSFFPGGDASSVSARPSNPGTEPSDATAGETVRRLIMGFRTTQLVYVAPSSGSPTCSRMAQGSIGFGLRGRRPSSGAQPLVARLGEPGDLRTAAGRPIRAHPARANA